MARRGQQNTRSQSQARETAEESRQSCKEAVEELSSTSKVRPATATSRPFVIAYGCIAAWVRIPALEEFTCNYASVARRIALPRASIKMLLRRAKRLQETAR